MELWPQFEARKREHLREALREEHQATQSQALDSIHLHHDALPELDRGEVRLGSLSLGKSMETPFFISGMTAGHADAPRLNRIFAAACEKRGWVFGLGSLRRDLTGGAPLEDWKIFREEFPKLEVLANLGVTQLPEIDESRLDGLLRDLRPHALVLHANALQECIQPEGTPRFRGVVARIRHLAQSISVPLVLKETGSGFSARTLKKLRGSGIRAIDVSGLGGTHWGRIEGARAPEGSFAKQASRTFASWGETTVDSVLAMKQELPETEIWASGGVRSGLDAAKLIALGAGRVGYAKSALVAALDGAEALDAWMALQEHELSLALFLTGSAHPADLRGQEGAWTRARN